MNKIVAILAIIIGITIGIIIAYMLKIPFAVLIVDTIKAKIAGINIGGVNIGSIASVASIIGLAGTAYQLLKANKDKVAAQVANAKQMLTNKETQEELVNTTNIKTQLEGKLAEATQLKDEAVQTLETKTQEFKGLTDQVAKLQEELKKRDLTIDTLHETLRRNKLSDDEVIEKIIVK